MNITVITPTKGAREDSLNRLRDFLRPFKYVQHLVIYSGEVPPVGEMAIPDPYGKSVFGNYQRDAARDWATGDCLVYCDDDDMLTEEGLKAIHWLSPLPNRCYGFSIYWNGTVMPSKQVIKSPYDMGEGGGRAGAQIVVPNVVDLPRWMDNNIYEADLHFQYACYQKYEVEVRPEILCIVRPEWG